MFSFVLLLLGNSETFYRNKSSTTFIILWSSWNRKDNYYYGLCQDVIWKQSFEYGIGSIRFNVWIYNQLNASDDRGIDVVREQIKDFAGTQKLFNSGTKLIILDEADNMTNAAQFALRRSIS